MGVLLGQLCEALPPCVERVGPSDARSVVDDFGSAAKEKTGAGALNFRHSKESRGNRPVQSFAHKQP